VLEPAAVERDAGLDGAGCTSTKVVAIKPIFGPVKTVWAGVKTTTQLVDCGGSCDHVAIKTVDFLHPGPVVVFKTTVTALRPTYKTKYACLPAVDGASHPRKTTRHHSGGRTNPVEPTFFASKRDADETETVYVATVTSVMYSPANCDRRQPGIPAPPPNPNRERDDARRGVASTVTVSATKTILLPGCDPTTVRVGPAPAPPAEPIDPAAAPRVVTPAGVASPSCTSTTMVWPEIPDSTWTHFARTATYTHTVDCKSCALSYGTGTIYFFAPITYTSTITAANPTTRTEFACRAKGTAEARPPSW
jgi:hypothetical protein